MALIQKKVTRAFLAANRANSRKSTGPRTELGKMHSRRNAAKHLIYAKVFAPSMKELGENPADFERLRDSLWRAFEPRDAFEEMLVEDMVELRWRRRRLLRAEAGILASKKRKFEIDHEWKLASRGKGAKAALERVLVGEFGLSGLADSPNKYLQILEALKDLRELVTSEGFQEDGLKILDVVYGGKPGLAALMLKASFESCRKQQEAGDADVQRMIRESFMEKLDAEIEAFQRLARLTEENNERLTEPMKDAQLLPCQEDLDKIMRYEAALERQFERKLQQLVAWRREKEEGIDKATSKRRAGSQDELG